MAGEHSNIRNIQNKNSDDEATFSGHHTQRYTPKVSKTPEMARKPANMDVLDRFIQIALENGTEVQHDEKLVNRDIKRDMTKAITDDLVNVDDKGNEKLVHDINYNISQDINEDKKENQSANYSFHLSPD